MTVQELVMEVLQSDPFTGYFLLDMDKQYSNNPKEVPTACVQFTGTNYRLILGKEFIDNLDTLGEKIFVVMHEVFHVIQEAATRNPEKKYHNLWNVALDIVVNQQVSNQLKNTRVGKDMATWKLLDSICTLEAINKKYNLDMPPNETSEFYYEFLNQALTESQKELMEYFNHDFGEMSEEEREVLKNKLKDAIENCRGNSPGMAEETLRILNKRRTSLKQELKKFVATQIALTKKNTKNKAHKRYGLPYNGTKLNRKLKLFVGIDTSGSVSDEQLKLIGSEVNALSNQGIELIILQSDYSAQDINKNYKASNEFKVKGRGGTSFVPYFETLKKHKDVDGVIIFSDMEVGIESEINRPRQKVLWVSTTDNSSPYFWGTKVKLGDL